MRVHCAPAPLGGPPQVASLASVSEEWLALFNCMEPARLDSPSLGFSPGKGVKVIWLLFSPRFQVSHGDTPADWSDTIIIQWLAASLWRPSGVFGVLLDVGLSRYRTFTLVRTKTVELTWHQDKHAYLVQKREKKKKVDEENRSQDEGKVCFPDVGELWWRTVR